MNPIPMIRQGAHEQTPHERLEDWYMRMEKAGYHASRKPYRTLFCSECHKPIWIIAPRSKCLVARCFNHGE